MNRFHRFILLLMAANLFAKPSTIEKYIMIDQFGYRPQDPKWAVLADPQMGFNAEDSYQPGEVFQIRKWDDDAVVYEGKPQVWNSGAVDFTSGDRGWWFDFSSVKDEGVYYILDIDSNLCSYEFEIK